MNCTHVNPSIMSFSTNSQFNTFINAIFFCFYFYIFEWTETLRVIQNTWKTFIKSNVKALLVLDFYIYSLCVPRTWCRILCVTHECMRASICLFLLSKYCALCVVDQWNNVKHSIYWLNERFQPTIRLLLPISWSYINN